MYVQHHHDFNPYFVPINNPYWSITVGLLYTGSLWYGEALKQVSNVASRTDSQQPTHSNNRSDTPLHSAAVFQSITKVTTIILNNNHCTMLTSINFKDQHAGDKVVLSAFRCVSFFCVAFLDALRGMFKFDKKTLHNFHTSQLQQNFLSFHVTTHRWKLNRKLILFQRSIGYCMRLSVRTELHSHVPSMVNYLDF